MKKVNEVEKKPRKKREKKEKKNVIILFDPNKIIINWD